MMSCILTMLRKWREKKEKEARGDKGTKEKKKVDKDTRNRMMDKELRCRNCRYVFSLFLSKPPPNFTLQGQSGR